MNNVRTTVFGGQRKARQTLINALEAIDESDDDALVVVVVSDGADYVKMGHSDGSAHEKIGMLEIARDCFVEAVRDDDS